MEGKKKLAVTLVLRADFPVIISKEIKALNFENFAVKLNAWTQRLNSHTKACDNVEVLKFQCETNKCFNLMQIRYL